MESSTSRSPARTPENSRPVQTWMAGGLVATGLVLAGLAANSVLQPAPMPYDRTMTAADPSSYQPLSLPEALRSKPDIQRLEWHTPGVRGPIASALVMRDREGRMVPLDWQNFVTEPVLAADLTITEVNKVLSAVREHVPKEAVVLSWWDLSRKIRLIAGRQAPLDDPLVRGLLVPTAWAGSGERVLAKERPFWATGTATPESGAFGTFIDALTKDELAGAEALRSLGGNADIYLAVHLSDIWKLASSRPDKIGIAYRDFPAAGQAHGVIKAVRQWMAENKMGLPYAIEPIGNAVRLHHFTDRASSQVLLAKLLPFSESNPMTLSQFDLVYQHRGFWIFKLKGPVAKSS